MRATFGSGSAVDAVRLGGHRSALIWILPFALPEFDDVPVAVGEAGLLGDAAGGGVAVAVHVERDGAIPQDLARGLGDELAGEPLPTMGWLGADRYLVPEVVVLLETDPGGVISLVIPGDQDIPVERAKPGWQTWVIPSNPFPDLGKVGWLVDEAEDRAAKMHVRATEEFRDRHIAVRGTELVLQRDEIHIASSGENGR